MMESGREKQSNENSTAVDSSFPCYRMVLLQIKCLTVTVIGLVKWNQLSNQIELQVELQLQLVSSNPSVFHPSLCCTDLSYFRRYYRALFCRY